MLRNYYDFWRKLIQNNKIMKKRLHGFLTLFLALVVQLSFAQVSSVTGTVTDEEGLSVPGVNVIVQGTNTGAQTDFDGKYSVTAATGDVLVFSYVGFATQTVTVGASDTIDVTLIVDAAALDEVIVVGYGKATKQSFTGTATVVSGERLEKKNVSDISEALAGEVAGVRVINTSGQPGSEATIRIRGIGSVNGSRDPLYVVDGVPYSGSISAINPSDIASTTVLKDAAATAIYGARGANGVIVINTKNGKAGEATIEIETKTGKNYNGLPRYETIGSPDQFLGLAYEALFNRGNALGNANPSQYASDRLFSASGIDPKYNFYNVPGNEVVDPATGMVRDGLERRYTPEDWKDFAFQASNRTETNLRISGGSENSTYYTSFGYLNDTGYSLNSDFERYSARLGASHDVKDWLSGTMDLGYTLSETNNGGQTEDSNSVFWFVDNLPSIYPLFLRDEAGNFVPDPFFGGNQYDFGVGRGFGALTNSIAHAKQDVENTKRHEINANAFLEATITDGLTLETRFGAQYFNSNYNSLGNPFYGGSAGQNGSIYKEKEQLFSYNFLQLLRYSKSFGDHSVEAFAAHESNSWETQYMWGSKNNLLDPNGLELNNGVVVGNPPGSYTNDYTLESYFGQLNYDFNDTYFLSGTVRRDGSSRFLNDKWGTFGAVGLAWVLSNENFMNNQNFLSFLKLKASYGLIGDQAGVGFYPGVDAFNVDNNNDEISLSFDTKGNPDLTWETSKMFQTGVEFTLGKYLEGSVDYYIKTTDDLIFQRREPISLGYAILVVNDGSLENTGLEFNLTGHVFKSNDFYLDLGVNGEIINNEILNMPIDPATGNEKYLDQQGLYGRAAGHSVFDFYTREWAGVDPANGVGMWHAYFVDANGNGMPDGGLMADGGEIIPSMTPYLIDNPGMEGEIEKGVTTNYAHATQSFVGKSAIPDARGAFNVLTGYKGFDLSLQFLYQIGGYAYDGAYATLMNNDVIGGNNWSVDILNRWQEPGDITNVPRVSSNYDRNVNSSSTRFLTKADYLALNNARLGYTIPRKFVEGLGLSRFNIFVSGDNLAIFSKRDGFNPSVSEVGASSMYNYSPLSTITGGVNITF